MKQTLLFLVLVFFFSNQALPQSNKLKVLLLKDTYSDSRTGPERLKGPELMDNDGLAAVMAENECEVIKTVNIEMPEKWRRQYGEWNRASLTNRVLNDAISDYDQDEVFIVGLLSGNKSLSGMLGGLQHMGPDRKPLKDSRNREIIGLPRLGEHKPLKVGLIWINPEAAFNTPDITMKGDMGGMNVAVAAGLCNRDLRLQAGLDPPISTRHIVMIGASDVTPYEEHLIDNSSIKVISVEELRSHDGVLMEEVERLSSQVDVVYVQVDLGIIGPSTECLVPGELESILEKLCARSEIAALGIAGCPEEADDQVLRDANQLIDGALKGVLNRTKKEGSK